MGILETETVRVSIAAPVGAVAADLADVTTHPEWATEFFAGSTRASDVDGEVRVDVPMMGGEVRMRAEATPELGVIDLYLAPAGAPYGPPIPIRVVPNGDGADVLFTLSRFPGTPDEAWAQGLASMTKELGNLKARFETRAAA